MRAIAAFSLLLLAMSSASAQEKSVVGLIPKTTTPITLDGKLTDWQGAFVTPVHVGHPCRAQNDWAKRFTRSIPCNQRDAIFC